ncbi:MAG: pyridoxal 5'-phosphate synthase glutaminase subunit PdxT [Thermodesulfobacteriota bacterium]|jgi:5'-phosphate synthase pdxT subunit
MIGVLDLQGGVVEHLEHLKRLGVNGRRVKKPQEVAGLSGLIIPGGESTCISKLVNIFGLQEVIAEEFKLGMKIWGTCAGAILLAKNIAGEAPHLALMDMDIKRNGFGSQLDSFSLRAVIKPVSPLPIPLTFIRAPKITRIGKDVNILLRIDDYVAAAETPGALATVFHPELTKDLSFHRYFLKKCQETIRE